MLATMNDRKDADRKAGNLRIALILASIAAAFFAGIIAKYLVFG